MRRLILAALTAASLAFAPAGAKTLDKGDGIHTEDWFKNTSFGDLGEDVAEAAGQGKLLAVVWEQEGCGSCKRLHEVNFQDAAVRRYLEANFDLMTLNMYGETEVSAPGGEAMPEKDLAADLAINFTPTTIFYDETGKEVFRVPGYSPPRFYLAAFIYVKEEGYKDPEHRGMFARWTKANRAKLDRIYGKPES